MLHNEQVEELIAMVSAMDRDELIRQLEVYPASFPVDFTNDFINRLSTDRLRHLFVALCLQSQRLPEPQATAA